MRNAHTRPGITPKLCSNSVASAVRGEPVEPSKLAVITSRCLGNLFPMYIVYHNPGARRRHRQPFLAREGAPGVLVTTLPVLTHRGAGKLVILGVALVGFLLVYDVQD